MLRGEPVPKVESDPRAGQSIFGRSIVVRVDLVCLQGTRQHCQLRRQVTSARPDLKHPVPRSDVSVSYHPLCDLIIDQIVLPQPAAFHFFTKMLTLESPSSSSTILLAIILAGSRRPTLFWMSSKLEKGCFSLISTISFMNVLPIPGISSRPWSLGVSG